MLDAVVRLFCCHGGIGPRLGVDADLAVQIEARFCEPTENPVIRDLTWSNPVEQALVVSKPARREYDLARLPPTIEN